MKPNFVKIQLHGILGEQIGRHIWNLDIASVGQGMNAIEVLSKRTFFKTLLDNDKKNIKYRVLVNGRDFIHEKDNPPSLQNKDSIINSELYAKTNNLQTIDIVPIIEGAGKDFLNIFTIILGVVLVVAGIAVSLVGGGPFGGALVLAGLGLIAAGVINLLSQPPSLEDFTARQKTSYLFSGPVNTVQEGGPVPVGYGRLIIGSSVVSASYDIGYFDASDKDMTIIN